MSDKYFIKFTCSLDCYQLKTYTVYKNDKVFRYCNSFEVAKQTITECLEVEEYNRTINKEK